MEKEKEKIGFWVINDKNNQLYGGSEDRPWDKRIWMFFTIKDAEEFLAHRKKSDKERVRIIKKVIILRSASE